MRRNTTLAGIGVWVSGRAAAAAGKSPNEKLNVAVIGAGGQGGSNLHRVASIGENIVALCDVDEQRAGKSFEEFPKAKKYHDFRKMLSEMDKQIDAVVVSTPDHTHAPAGMMAMKMGKHCYCEKPLTRAVYESRVMAEVAKQNNLATQLGSQHHATDNYHRAVELVQSGAIGPVDEVHVWVPTNFSGGDRPTDRPPVPERLHWDLWLGPAPWRPYHPYYAPFKWRGWWDFGNGGLGDFFCHFTDVPFWALKLRYPTTVEVEGPPIHPEACAPWLIVRYEFPARGQLPPVRLTWYHGYPRPEQLDAQMRKDWSRGILFIGHRKAGWWSTMAVRYCCRSRSLPASSHPIRSSPSRLAIITNGSSPARRASRPHATSTTPVH